MLRLSLGFVAALLVLWHDDKVEGAAIIEDHSSTWLSANLTNALARGTDEIFPQELYERVMEEALVFEAHEKNERQKAQEGGAYMHGKGGTFWRPLFDGKGNFLKPRFAIEAAIQLLYQNDVQKDGKHPRVLGGEWWVQKRELNSDIGYHHDKDEAMASLKATMKFPEISTVTYLTDAGAPTLIFNQTTPDGNGQEPWVPNNGFLSYPKANRHMIFRGNLLHGVSSYLTPSTELQAVKLRGIPNFRVTFLVNWWAEKPMGPNCNPVETKMVKGLGLYDKEGVASLLETAEFKTHKPIQIPVIDWELPPDPTQRQRFEISSPGEDNIWYELPKDRDPGNLYYLEWGDHTIIANTARLDLQSRIVRALFHDRRPKVILFVRPGKEENKLLKYLGPLARDNADHFKFVVANPARTQDALRTFGLTFEDTPTAVIHLTQPTERKYLMPGLKKRRAAGDAKKSLNEKSLRKMIQKYRDRKLSPMGGHDADE